MSDDLECPDCFVIMPISDPQGYAPGHFHRVYKHALAPAISMAGYRPLRADDVNNTNYIVVDLLQRVISTPLAICDLSARNPNVFFELGIRQAFDMPVVLVKDSQTERVFDIQGLRTIEYDASLRVDAVAEFHEKLVLAIKETLAAPKDSVNSLIRLLNVQPAKVEQPAQLSQDTSLLLSAIRDINSRIDSLDPIRQTTEASLSSGALPPIYARVSAEVRETLLEMSERQRVPSSRLAGQAVEEYLSTHPAEQFDSLPTLAATGPETRTPLRLSIGAFKDLRERSNLAAVPLSSYAGRILASVIAP